jgi:hypothetical protein
VIRHAPQAACECDAAWQALPRGFFLVLTPPIGMADDLPLAAKSRQGAKGG